MSTQLHLDRTLRFIRNSTEGIMAAYLIVSFDIVDVPGFDDYVSKVVPLIDRHGGKILVSAGAPRLLEGRTPGTNVVISFPTDAEAMAFYEDPEYQPVKAIRLGATRNTTAIVATGSDR